MKEVLLYKATGRLAGFVVVDQGGVLLRLGSIGVGALAGLVYEEVGHVLGGQDRVVRVVDGLVGNAL